MLLTLLAIPVLFGSSTPVVPTPVSLPSYLTVDAADAIAGGLYGVLAYTAASAADKGRALATASRRVDASRRWQGRRADPVQRFEFPRMDGCLAIDAEPSTGRPVVPDLILYAVVHEASSLLDGERAVRVAAQHDGLAAQAIGTASETYRPPTATGGTPILCFEADSLVERYRLRSGRLR